MKFQDARFSFPFRREWLDFSTLDVHFRVDARVQFWDAIFYFPIRRECIDFEMLDFFCPIRRECLDLECQFFFTLGRKLFFTDASFMVRRILFFLSFVAICNCCTKAKKRRGSIRSKPVELEACRYRLRGERPRGKQARALRQILRSV